MIIRVADDTDIPLLIEFQVSMAKETENVSLDRELLRAGMSALFADSAKGSYYIAEDQGTVVGCMMTTAEWSEWRNGTILWIQSLYVVPEYRRRGVYRSLYLHLQKKVEHDASLRGIRLYVDTHNRSAQEVYNKLGMNGDHYQVFEWMK